MATDLSGAVDLTLRNYERMVTYHPDENFAIVEEQFPGITEADLMRELDSALMNPETRNPALRRRALRMGYVQVDPRHALLPDLIAVNWRLTEEELVEVVRYWHPDADEATIVAEADLNRQEAAAAGEL